MKWFNNLKVARKVLLASMMFLSIILIVLGLSIKASMDAQENFEGFFNDRFIPVRQLNSIVANLLEIRINMSAQYEAIRTNDMAEYERRGKYTAEMAEAYNKEWAAFNETEFTEEEAKLAREWETLSQIPLDARRRYAEALLARDFDTADAALAEWVDGFRNLRDKTGELLNLQEQEGDILREQVAADARQTLIIDSLLLVLGLFFSIIITIILARSVSGPVNKGLEFAKKIAAGDFTERIDLDQKDELGELGQALNTAADNLEELVGNVMAAADNLVTAVDQIAMGNQNLSQRTSEQASALEEIASTLEETTATVNQNADNSGKANEMSATSAELAQNGGDLVGDAVNSINEINETSAKIGEIITVINDIAFQTNLLALNAAVEAARAGEQGRGFAVVAGEVRNLAQRSGNAAKEIGDLIKESLSKITLGTDKANKSGEALQEIIKSINGVSKMINEIAAASIEQKQGMNQINIAVTEMDTMTQQNAALVEETASASEEMANQAQELMAMMQQFKVNAMEAGQKKQKKHLLAHHETSHAAPVSSGQDREKKKSSEPKTKAVVHHDDHDLKNAMESDGFEEF